MTNKYVDENGQPCSRDRMEQGWKELARIGDLEGYYELRQRYDSLVKIEERALLLGISKEALDVDEDILEDLVKERENHSSNGNQVKEAFGLLLKRTNDIAISQGETLDFTKRSAQAMASQLGNVMEQAFERQARKYIKNNPNAELKHFYSGKEIATAISKARREVAKDSNNLDLLINKLQLDYQFSHEYAKKILVTKSGIHIPDSVAFLDTPNGKLVRVAEAKTSGENDSSSVPKNLEKLVPGTDHSAVEPWVGNNNVRVEAALILTATLVKNGQAPTAKRWQKAMEIKGYEKFINLKVNEHSYAWLTNTPADKDFYNKGIINVAAWAVFKDWDKI